MKMTNPQMQLLINVDTPGSRVFHDDKGRLHNDTGPAVINTKGEFAWFHHGLLHREDGPAVKTRSGHELWSRHGRTHRVGGPATTYSDGSQEWCENGEYHRIDGPARDYTKTGRTLNEWYVRGLWLTEQEFNLYIDQSNGDILIPPGKTLRYGMRFVLRPNTLDLIK